MSVKVGNLSDAYLSQSGEKNFACIYIIWASMKAVWSEAMQQKVEIINWYFPSYTVNPLYRQ